MTVVAEIPALKFKFDVHALPSLGSYLPHGLAVGKPRLNPLDHVAEFFGEHPKEKHDALLVHWLGPRAPEFHLPCIPRAVRYAPLPSFFPPNHPTRLCV